MNKFSSICYLFTAIGLVLLAASANVYMSTKEFISTANSAQGTVINFERSRSSDDIGSNSYIYTPVVNFQTAEGNAISFTSSSGSSRPQYSIGESVEVLYQANKPRQAKIHSSSSLWGLTVILAVLGTCFAIPGLILLLVTRKKNNLKARLKQEGIPVSAQFTGIQLNRSLSFNGKNPYQLVAQWKDPATSREHVFNSENLWYDPRNQIQSDNLTVYIEDGNPKKYYVDISFLSAPTG